MAIRRRKSLDQNKGYAQFLADYKDNPIAFMADCLHVYPSWQQAELIIKLHPDNAKVSVSSGHGCFGLGTEIMMSTGEIKPVESVVVGDRLMGDDGAARNVLELYRGRERMYRFTYRDNTSHVFNESHILHLVACSRADGVGVGDAVDVRVRDWLQWDDDLKSRFAILRQAGDDWRWIPIVSTENLGVGDYYGFEIDGDGRFLGGCGAILNNTGKGFITAAIAIHFILCHPRSLVMLTANNIDQVQRVIFKYLRQHWRTLERIRPDLARYFTLTATTLYETAHKDSWCVFGKTSSKGNEEGLAGQHAEDMLIVVDEASGVGDKAFDTLWGVCTQRNNKMLLTSQYTKPSGHFAESQTTLAKIPGNPDGLYDVIVMNSEESPHVTEDAIRGYIKRFGGRDSPEYGIRVLGICPDNAEGYLIPRSLAARGFDAAIEHDDDYGYVGCVDVATDGLRDKSEVTICKVSGYDDLRRVEVVLRWTAPPGMDGIRLATELEHMGKMYPNITWAIDGDGYGKATCQEAERLGLTVARISWGKPVHSKEKQDQYFNKRSYSAVMVRDALRDGRLKLKANSVKERDTTLTQFSKIPYGFTDGVARWKLKSKEWMRENGIKSPDIFDTHCFVWLVDYIPAGEDVVVANDDDAGDPWEGMLNAE